MLTLATLKKRKKLSKKSFSLLNNKAFTLLEVMIVVLIIATVMTMAIPRLSSDNQKIKADIRRFSVLARRVLQQAQLKKNTYRLVIDMGDKDSNEKRVSSYWIESANGSSFASANDYDTQTESKDDDAPPPKFQRATDLLKTPKELPEDYIFSEVSFGDRDTITEGKAYIYFFPHGFTEESLIKIKHISENIHWSLLINPLTGYVDILSQDVSLKELKQGN